MSSTGQAEPNARIVLQRVRNRIVEYFELLSSFQAQQEYQAKVPFTVVPELIDQWDDWVVAGWEASYVKPIFSDEERAEIAKFGKTWSDVADRLPAPLPLLSEAQRMDDWRRLREAAECALRIFERRGRLAENEDHSGGIAT